MTILQAKVPFEYSIQHYKELPSTNAYAHDLASQGANEGLVIVADFQTQGHGKLGRKWISPKGKNLLFSVLLRPPITVNQAPMLTQIACRSIATILKDQYKIASSFKRPNDILVKGKKICGVLVEASTLTNDLQSAVVGIGLNVNSEGKDLLSTATSLKDVTGRQHSRERLLKAILVQLQMDLKGLYACPT